MDCNNYKLKLKDKGTEIHFATLASEIRNKFKRKIVKSHLQSGVIKMIYSSEWENSLTRPAYDNYGVVTDQNQSKSNI